MAYLDHAATTPMHPAAIEAMAAVQRTIGNASSLHTSGRSARRRIEEARELIADKLGARPSEVIFTAGAPKATTWLSKVSIGHAAMRSRTAVASSPPRWNTTPYWTR